MVIDETTKGKYRGWGHDKIIEKQNEKIHAVLTSKTPPLDVVKLGKTDLKKRKGIIEERKTERSDAKELRHKVKARKKDIQNLIYGYGESPLTLSTFRLAGLGDSGENCGQLVMTDVDIGENEDDIRAVKFKPLRCGRIECSECYHEWAIRQTFDIVLRIEVMAELRGERPFHTVFSIHPSKCEGMTWDNVNRSIWRRGIRRLRYKRCETARKFKKHNIKKCPDCYTKKIRCDDVGKRGHNVESCPDCYNKKVRCEVHKRGIEHKVESCPDCFDLDITEYASSGAFHPYRVQDKWKDRWGKGVNANEDDLGVGRYWEKIRTRLKNNQGKLEDYVKIGFHCHSWTFTDHADKQENEEYFIKFCGNFKRYDREEVVAMTRYLITHTATIKEATVYRQHVCEYCGHSYRANEYRCGHCGRVGKIKEKNILRNRVIHPIRNYGTLHRFNPKQALIKKYGEKEGKKKYHQIAKAIAKLLFLRKVNGEMVTMEWDDEEEELVYPAYPEELDTSERGRNWVSIYKLFELLVEPEFGKGMDMEKYIFAEDLVDYLETQGKPPPLEDCTRDPFEDKLYIPEMVRVEVPLSDEDKFDRELKRSRLEDRGLTGVSFLHEKITELLRESEEDVWGLDICLANYKLGQILPVLEKMAERGEIIMIGESVQLNVPVAPVLGKQTALERKTL